MRALVQRVSRASVTVDGQEIATIGPGLLVLLGVAVDDDEPAGDRLADRVAALRVFDDGEGRMNEPVGARGPLRQPVHALRRHAERQPPELRGGGARRGCEAAV